MAAFTILFICGCKAHTQERQKHVQTHPAFKSVCTTLDDSMYLYPNNSYFTLLQLRERILLQRRQLDLKDNLTHVTLTVDAASMIMLKHADEEFSACKTSEENHLFIFLAYLSRKRVQNQRMKNSQMRRVIMNQAHSGKSLNNVGLP